MGKAERVGFEPTRCAAHLVVVGTTALGLYATSPQDSAGGVGWTRRPLPGGRRPVAPGGDGSRPATVPLDYSTDQHLA